MASKPNLLALSVAAELLVEADGIRSRQAVCIPRLSSHEPSIADSGFYSSSERSSSDNIIPDSCRATQEMVRLSRELLSFYCEKKISIDDVSVDIRAEFGDEPTSRALETLPSSCSITHMNAWILGSRVASHLLSSLPKDRPDDSCELEADVEVYLSLILSIAGDSDASSTFLERARKLCKQRQGEIFKHIRRVQVLLSNSIAFPSSPKSPCEEQRFIPNHLRRQNRKSVRSILSTSSIPSCFLVPSTSSKGPAVPAAVLNHFETMGSFAVTPPARRSLRHVMSQTTRPRRIPSLWQLRIPSAPECPPEAVGDDGLPTISRTPSTTGTASSSEGPSTPILVSSPLAYETNGTKLPAVEGISTLPSLRPSLSKLNPILAKVERCSQFRTITECSACQKVGLDFPKCPRCEEMWCSRECRLRDGKRHVCQRT